MISYQIYKVIHLGSVFILLTALALAFQLEKGSKKQQMAMGIASLFIFVGGMGMMARLGIKHAEPWPLWLLLKAIIWVLLTIPAAIMAKRLKNFRKPTLYVCVALAILAAAIVINQAAFI